MIRVGMKGDNFVILFFNLEAGTKSGIEISPRQAADLRAQLGGLLPSSLHDVLPFSSDPPEASKHNGYHDMKDFLS